MGRPTVSRQCFSALLGTLFILGVACGPPSSEDAGPLADPEETAPGPARLLLLPPLNPAYQTVLYDDAVAPGWDAGYSWGSVSRTSTTSTKAYGASSMQVSSAAYSALALGAYGQTFSTSAYAAVSFALSPGTSNLAAIKGLKLIVSQEGTDGNAGVMIGTYANPSFDSLGAGEWTRVTVPMSALKGTLTTFNKLTLMAETAVSYGIDGIAIETPRSSGGKPYPTGVAYRGINRAGMEYGNDWDGWTGQTYYEMPASPQIAAELAYYKAKGFNLIRLPISWERLQHTLLGPLDTAYSNGMMNYINLATAQGFTLVLDLHNYNRYATGAFDGAGNQTSNYVQRVIGDGTLTVGHLADVWTKLANLVKTNPRVILGLMNEPHDLPMTSTTWFSGIQTVINAVRATGSTQLLLVPNSRGSDVGHWHTWAPGGGPLDSVVALTITDSANNHAFDMHSYYPEGYGSNDESSYGAQLTAVTNWARTHGKKLFLTEMGIPIRAPIAQAQITNALTFMNNHGDVWMGWSPWDLTDWQLTANNHTADYTTNGLTPILWYSAFLTPNFLAL
ncbi:glycoside hydrolase family 5 protein [Myxococcus landrumensis]|uniref:Glycoside hydrolase family 5 protein n=1 Tax=Myxococcus landrumensis TaxID=2813577 RepID=A0ABX7NJM2_9BACT|nr:glycoside hydrolase family 5 protein [Myxococcus landrumus]QSQ17674.1 glycoside hydrolase family 5 protein [Myxococcus landrumus]